jgi:DNA-binding transcriptional MerR regulator
MESSQMNTNTLQHVTKRKLEKLSEYIDKFELRKGKVLSEAAGSDSLRQHVEALIEGAKQNGFSIDRAGTSIKNIKRYLAQAEYDPSVSEKQINEWKELIEREIEVQGRKLIYAKLFGKLCTEWTQRPNKPNGSASDASLDETDADSDTSSTTSSFVAVGRKEMQEQRDQWERYAFTELPKDQATIDAHLKDLFEFTKKSKKLNKSPLHQLQLAMGKFEETEPKRFTGYVIEQCIDGLLKADFFSGAKRQELVEMKDKEEILGEIADVLNMDLDSIETWDWEKPVALHQRRQLNGKYRVYYDEEIHQAIFLQWIGMKWAVLMKQAFEKFFHSGSWTQAPYRALDKSSKQRRDYFLGTAGTDTNNSVRANRRSIYQKEFFMLQLPNSMDAGVEDYGDHDNGRAHGAFKHPAQKKDLLHRLVTTEMLVQTAVYGECTILQSDFKWFGPSIPHDTIFAVLKFLGVKGKWLDFFRKYLQAKVYWDDEITRSEPDITQFKQRRRGIPMTHVLSDALGEAILFCMDFAVSKATGGADLHRFHDDLWFWGQEEVVVKAWKTIEDFSAIMGLELNMEKTGCAQVFAEADKGRELPATLPKGNVTWGLLKLDAKENRWVIDEKKVQDHVKELDRQLRACNSVFAWIQAWNSYACRFLSVNLGHPSNCFGVAHVESVLRIFSGIQQQLFGPGGSAHEHLRRMLADPERRLCDPGLDVDAIPDAFFYFPMAIGGLETQNPFIKPLAMRNQVPKEIDKIILQAFESDEEDFEKAKKRYEDGEYIARPVHANTYVPAENEEFMSLGEFINFREECSPHLAQAYNDLLGVPEMEDVEATPAIRDAVDTAEGCMRWRSLSPYEHWLFELYGREVMGSFGGLGIGERSMLPLGMVESLKSERTRWLE